MTDATAVAATFGLDPDTVLRDVEALASSWETFGAAGVQLVGFVRELSGGIPFAGSIATALHGILQVYQVRPGGGLRPECVVCVCVCGC